MARDRATSALEHYFVLALERAGVRIDNDMRVEMGAIVDDIIAAATPPSAAETEHAERVRSAMTAAVDGPDPRD